MELGAEVEREDMWINELNKGKRQDFDKNVSKVIT